MAKATHAGVKLTLSEDEAQFLVDLLYHHVDFDNATAEGIYSALIGVGIMESNDSTVSVDILTGAL